MRVLISAEFFTSVKSAIWTAEQSSGKWGYRKDCIVAEDKERTASLGGGNGRAEGDLDVCPCK